MTTSLEIAILRSILYADVFDFPMTSSEIHHFLIYDLPVSYSQIEQTLNQSAFLSQRLACNAPYFALRGREWLVEERQRREIAAGRLWPLALRYGAWLSRLPYVRMVALTGALAVRNSPNHKDDLDFLIVTGPKRVWLARACAILLVRALRLRGITLCPNYLLDDSAMEQERKDVFIAHQIAQMIPISGYPLYERFRQTNQWTDTHLPNANGPFYVNEDYQPGGLWLAAKNLLEALLNGRLGDSLESWERKRKLARFADDLQNPHSSARLDSHQVKGHFNDYGRIVLAKYNERLREHQIEALAPPDIGD